MANKKEVMRFHKVVGSIIKEMAKEVGWSNDKLARKLTIQIYKNLPDEDSDFPIPITLSSKQENNACSIEDNVIIHNYIENTYKKTNQIIMITDKDERSLMYAITTNMINSYLCGRTPVPTLELICFCQLLNISIESFMSNVYSRLGLKWNYVSPIEHTMKDVYSAFSQKVFGNSENDRYVYDAVTQGNLLSSLLFDGKNEIEFHFTYLPRIIGLRALKDNKEVIYQRGILTFVMKDGMCHVTSKLEVSSQGIPTEYRGFAIVMNPYSVGPSCTCFLREINNAFGIFIIFSFRLSQLERNPKRQTRISECMSVRKDDGTSYVYRLLLSKNYIDDEEMKYFVGHLKIGTSENANTGDETKILIKDKYIKIAKKYFSGLDSNGTKEEDLIYADLNNYFGEENKKCYLDLIKLLEQSSSNHIEDFHTIYPKMLNIQNNNDLLFLGWLGKCGLSARNDKIENALDDYVEDIHKMLYPELHLYKEGESGYWHY